MTSYRINIISDQLVYIAWDKNPLRDEAYRFIDDLTVILDDATQPLYFLSDLRNGRIIDIRAIHLLSELTTHRNWAGSTAFSENPLSKLFTMTFRKGIFNDLDRNTFFATPEEAISFLEVLSPGISECMEWAKILA